MTSAAATAARAGDYGGFARRRLLRAVEQCLADVGGALFINGGAHATLAHCTFTANASLGGNGGGRGGVIDGEGTWHHDRGAPEVDRERHDRAGLVLAHHHGTTLLLESSTLYANTSTTAGTLATPGGIYTLVNDTIVGKRTRAPTRQASTCSRRPATTP